jgi:hypothetical protein
MTHALAYLIFAYSGFHEFIWTGHWNAEPYHELNQSARDLCGTKCPAGYIWFSSWWWSEITVAGESNGA